MLAYLELRSSDVGTQDLEQTSLKSDCKEQLVH